MNDNKINILCATDENYASQCGIMLTSVLVNNANVDVYVLISSPLSKRNMKRFCILQSRFKNPINFINVNKSLFEKMPSGNRYLPDTAYYRLCAAQLLPPRIEKCLYLDCDMIIDGSLDELWNIDLNNHSAAVVSDVWYQRKEIYERLKYEPSLSYFNSGMILINLKYWRQNNLQKKFFDCVRDYGDCIEAHDQDILNVVLAESKIHVPIKWNFEIAGYARQYYESFPVKLQREIDNLKPVVIHYCGTIIRPWMLDYYNYPFAKIWMKYKKKSPWKYQLYCFKSNRHLLRKIIKRFVLWPFGYKKTTECEFIDINNK